MITNNNVSDVENSIEIKYVTMLGRVVDLQFVDIHVNVFAL